MSRQRTVIPLLLAALVAAAALASLPAPSAALTPLSQIRYSPDITAVFGGVRVDDDNVADDNLAGLVTLVNVGAIPPETGISAYHCLPNGDHLLSFDTPVTLPGGLTASTGDIVHFDGTTYTLFFNAAAHGLPVGVITDALFTLGSNDLFLSFDVTVALGAVTADDEDLVRVQGNSVTLFFDGSAAGVPPELDLDAAHCLDRNGHLLLSFDGSGSAGGVSFDDEDVLEFTPTTGSWEMAYDGSVEHGGWPAADLEALFATTAPPSTSVPPAIQGGPSGDGGLHSGSTRVFGKGTPHGKAGDVCIEIYAVGPNGVPDNPAGSVDDILLGTGGTDAQGNFVDAAEMAGIGLSQPLAPGDRLFAVDVCEGLASAIVSVPAPAPLLSGMGLCIAVALLGVVGVLRLPGPRLRRAT